MSISSLPGKCRVFTWQCPLAAALFSMPGVIDAGLASLLCMAMANPAAPVLSPSLVSSVSSLQLVCSS